ncbi:MAG TPA: carbohydrate kinase [Aggregatilinea sp.]|jgi:fructokinase|uniref:carbohydrate kinase family protein n=1 Tax=Aggregatilinea sp. TaxID=2806333 RepID=UPI002B8BB478|nr:carbohydrate kinase [Aggregatilinea sp.]HML23686.1 carbohydrate kinase [Aggregatilinea sp.]
MDVLCIGEALIDFVSRERGVTLVTAEQFTAAAGGAPANVAAGLARLGRHARLIATVGDDAFGRKIIHELNKVGVDCKLHVDPQHFTTLAFVKLGAEGDRDFEFSSGAHDYFTPDQVDPDEVREALVLHYGSISLRAPSSREATIKAIQIAKDAGILCSCDPNWRADLWPDQAAGRAAMLEAVAYADILKISDADLAFLAPDHADDFITALDAIGFQGKLAAVTLGAKGAWYKAGEITGQVPSPHVQVVETTGSGDAFVAALLDCLLTQNLDIDSLSEADLERVIRRACAAGALTATGYGAIPSLPDPAGIDALLRMVSVSDR